MDPVDVIWREELGKTAVLWDFDECPVPEDRDCDHVSTYLKWALWRIGSLSGDLQIFAFGDVSKLPKRVVEGFLFRYQTLRLTRLNGSLMRKFIENWIKENPDTKTYLIISNNLKLCESIFNDLIDKDKDRQLFIAHTRESGFFQKFPSLNRSNCPLFVWNFRTLLHGGVPENFPEICLKQHGFFKQYDDDDDDDADYINFPPMLPILSSFSTIDLSRVELPVWWDIESCPVPMECEVAYVPNNIQCSLVQEGLRGYFTLFVDTTRLRKSHINTRYNKEIINIVGVKYSREEMIKAMAEWGDKSPHQSTCVLISRDVAYERILRNLGCKHKVVVGGGWPTLLHLTSSPYGLPISYLWDSRSLAHGDFAMRNPSYWQNKVRSLIDARKLETLMMPILPTAGLCPDRLPSPPPENMDMGGYNDLNRDDSSRFYDRVLETCCDDRSCFYDCALETCCINDSDADSLITKAGIMLELWQSETDVESINLHSASMLEECIDLLKMALKVDPRKHDAYWCLGNAYTYFAFFFRDLSEASIYFNNATRCFTKAFDLDPSELYRISLEVSSMAPELHAIIHKHGGFDQQEQAMAGESTCTNKESTKKGKSSDFKKDVFEWILLAVGIVACVRFATSKMPGPPRLR